jgi:hypothetical protein
MVFKNHKHCLLVDESKEANGDKKKSNRYKRICETPDTTVLQIADWIEHTNNLPVSGQAKR